MALTGPYIATLSKIIINMAPKKNIYTPCVPKYANPLNPTAVANK